MGEKRARSDDEASTPDAPERKHAVDSSKDSDVGSGSAQPAQQASLQTQTNDAQSGADDAHVTEQGSRPPSEGGEAGKGEETEEVSKDLSKEDSLEKKEPKETSKETPKEDSPAKEKTKEDSPAAREESEDMSSAKGKPKEESSPKEESEGEPPAKKESPVKSEASSKKDASPIKSSQGHEDAESVSGAATAKEAPPAFGFSGLAKSSPWPKKDAPAFASSSFGAFASTNPWTKKAAESKTPDTGASKPVSGGFGSFASISPFSVAKAAEKADESKTEEAEESRDKDDDKPPSHSEGISGLQQLDQIVTGEESEVTLHSARCKLYYMDNGAWHERGVGLLKLNQAADNSGSRLLMRADGTGRLLLNAPLFAKFSSSVYAERYIKLTCIEDQLPRNYMLRLANAELAEALEGAIEEQIDVLFGEREE